MQVVVDGIIFELNPGGGVARLFRELLPRLCLLDPDLRLHLIANRSPAGVDGACLARLPLQPPLENLRPRRLFLPLTASAAARLKGRATRGLHDAIWHPTYYTFAAGWRGAQVFTVYDLLYERYPDQFNRREDQHHRRQKRACIERADALICISQTAADDLRSCYPVEAGRIHVIPLAASPVFRVLDPFTPPLDQPYLLYVGERRFYKNFEQVLRAYHGWQHRDEVALVVVGRAFSAAERRQIARLKLDARVHLRTRVSDDVLCRWYNGAVGFVYPSLYEGFGVPLLEAAACGCPIIASNIPSTREVMGDIPLYFEASRANAGDALIAGFDRALAEGRQTERTARGRERAHRFNWEQTAAQTLAVYRQFQHP